MGTPQPHRLRALVTSLLLLACLIGAWHIATSPQQSTVKVDEEYAKLVGAAAATGQKSAFPQPLDVARKFGEHLSDPFYDRGPNDKGLGIQLAYSIARVALGFGLAAVVAVPLGFLIGMSRTLYSALDPFIQVLKPVSPLAWMPLALFTLKDSSISAIFVIFVCSIWPMLINTAFGVASVMSFLNRWEGVLSLVGGVILLLLGWRALFSPPPADEDRGSGVGLLGAFISTFGMTIANPMTVLSFIAVFAALGAGAAATGAAGLPAELPAFFSRKSMALPTVSMCSAASSGISHLNSSSNAMTSSTVSRLSAPRSSMNDAFSVTFSASTPRCWTTIFFTRSAISLIELPRSCRTAVVVCRVMTSKVGTA